ncbi:dihydroorotate dehydrogenase electron transfer subunit [Actinoalloteichus hoggarensis]|uniref:Dihydroorotate dehydrogenase B (NAD(+)), electron transfer subunit n=1 Tax=Actinoalloteichus hoggarensis TaxID=1470176 RepID=A0A221W7N7_9PSEU|nr:FAD-binding oxidoreductase [Actinoalloteichus hoggarensis]ASO22000.1 Dihydroorotate dehydrogenase B (NAD(+)), electron transfer subunit [Actinoalloteichus hoggarensis]MBB5923920.1 dihydroorotate dehydrogenase electron transfer subunit [Actinoalloteichus hoggarensis]
MTGAETDRRGIADRIAPLPRSTRPTPTWDECAVLVHEPVGDTQHRLVLHSPTIAERTSAGQFVMVTIPAGVAARSVLPRPMAVHRRRVDDGAFEIVYRAGGAGTQALTAVRPGESLLITGPLGQGFTLAPATERLLVVGRGIGVCSIMTVVEDAVRAAIAVTGVLSARTEAALVGSADLAELGVGEGIAVTDEAGTSDVDRLAARLRTLLDDRPPQQIMVCGSDRLARLCGDLASRWGATVQVSVEAHMACGLGYCHGCASAAATTEGESPLVCADGPVFALTGGGRT